MGKDGRLTKMRVVAFRDEQFLHEVGARDVQINPETYQLGQEICYVDDQAQGASGGSPSFNKIPSDKLSLQLIFDGTGVLPASKPDRTMEDGVADEIERFRRLVFTYKGNIHQPNYLKLIWGTLLFTCRLQKLNITYRLFKPDGSPLRATANASFIGFNDEETLALQAKKSSPDLTHVRTVRAGDRLPLLCEEIYGSSAYYPQVAQANGLTEFRRLEVGRRLLFPPLSPPLGEGA